MATSFKSPGADVGGKKHDEESDAIIFQGASLAQLGKIFQMDSRDLSAKINGNVMPVGMRGGYAVYSIKEVAPYLVSPPYDMDEFIQKMTAADLPTNLRKEFWAGMRSRQLFEKEAAELWPTSEVADMVADIFKTLSLSLRLSREAIGRETELTPRQRQIVDQTIDNALKDLYASTICQFAAPNLSDTSGDDANKTPSEEEL